MLKYDLKKLASSTARRRPGQKILLPVIERSAGAEVSYLKVLRDMLRGIFAAVKRDVLPVVERELAQQRQGQRVIGDVDSATFERIKRLGEQLGLIAIDAIERILGLEAIRHTKQFMTSAKKVLGIDLNSVVDASDLRAALETMATRNAGLIKGLSDDVIRRVQTTVTNAVLNGIPASELRKTLTADFQFGDKRAKLIARDQIAKTTSDLNRLRHQQAGISEYVWRTSKDERVRPRHVKCDGKTFKYGQPTLAEQGLPPGQPIQCRCVAQAIVEF